MDKSICTNCKKKSNNFVCTNCKGIPVCYNCKTKFKRVIKYCFKKGFDVYRICDCYHVFIKLT